jgi:GAF domain-containing protein
MRIQHSATKELASLNRALRTLSGCNHALLRADDEAALLQEICRVVVEEAGYRIAWVGRAEHDERKTVRPVAQAGIDKDFVDAFDLTWADTARGDMLGSVIRTGNPRVIRDIQTDPGFSKSIQRDPSLAPLREEAPRRGYVSVLILPLRVDSEVFGIIALASSDSDAFGDKEIKLLSQAAEDLAFGIETLRMKLRRFQAEQEIRRLNRALRTRAGVAHAVTHASDETTLLQEICRLAVEDCGYDLAWIGYIRHDAANTMRLMAHAGFDPGFLALPYAQGAMESVRGCDTVPGTERPCVLRDISLFDPPCAKKRSSAAITPQSCCLGAPTAN